MSDAIYTVNALLYGSILLPFPFIASTLSDLISTG